MIKSLKLLFLLPIWILAQDYPIAPEIWSEPELIDEISDFFPNDEIVSVSVTGDGQKLFIHLADIAYLEKTDSGWSNPEFLNENINSGTVGWPCISPNGERLFFSRYSNGWNLYYSDWDSLMNDWGESKNCGPGINLSETVHCSIPNDSTIIFGREGQTYISMLDKINNIWSEGRGFPDDDNPYYSENGFFISSDFLK